MLVNLHISNYALIERLDVEFGRGLSIITGETGAGKTIILGAIDLLRGRRADSSALRDFLYRPDGALLRGLFGNAGSHRRIMSLAKTMCWFCGAKSLPQVARVLS